MLFLPVGTCYSEKNIKPNDSDPLQTKYLYLEKPDELSQAQVHCF